MKKFHIHLVSDATGETVLSVANACLVQFSGVKPQQHIWSLVRTQEDVENICKGIEENPGIVLFTLVNKKIRNQLQKICSQLDVPCVSILNPVITALSNYFDVKSREEPGRQHIMDAEYFNRIDAISFVLSHDDGQSTKNLDKADVIIVGVSRTSKTPTCLYLANKGIFAANIPFIPGSSLPSELMNKKEALIVGLTSDPERLVEIRKNRLNVLNQDENTDYVDIDVVGEEVMEAEEIFSKNDWPVIDITHRSIEEVTANIVQLYSRYREESL